MPVIETRELAKTYREVQALKGVDIDVERGEIYGLLGQNGAGKSTLIKILLGIVHRSGGEARLFGEPIGPSSLRKRVGYLPEDHRFPEYHSASSLLNFYGQLYGISRHDRLSRIEEILEKVGLKGRMNSKIRTYSKGMKQRLGIAQAIFHEPELIILDEPTDGVDPIGRREIRDMIQDLKQKGSTIFLNSHLLGEVEQICDRVGILQRGSKVREGDIASFTKQKGWFVVGLAEGEIFPEEDVRGLGYEIVFDKKLWEVRLNHGQEIDPLVSYLTQKGLRLRHLLEKRQTLEDTFMQTVESSEPGVDRARRARKDDDRPRRKRSRDDRDDEGDRMRR